MAHNNKWLDFPLLDLSPTVVDDQQAHIAACNGTVVRPLDVYVANMTRQGGRQTREGVHRRGERTAAGFQQCSEVPSSGGQKIPGEDRGQVLLVLGLRLVVQTFFEDRFFPTGS